MPKTQRRKQKLINMIGCKSSKTCKKNKSKRLGICSKCGPNCHCGPNCNCPHPCPGTCYLNYRFKGGNCGGMCPVNMSGGYVYNDKKLDNKKLDDKKLDNKNIDDKKNKKHDKKKHNRSSSQSLYTSSSLSKTKTKSKSKNKKGGASLFSQDLINLGRSFQFNLSSAYNTLNAHNGTPNPMPHKDQLPTTKYKLIV